MKCFVLSWCVLTSLASPSRAGVFNGIDFPLGAASFADAVLRYDPFYNGGPAPTTGETEWTLGVPLGPYKSLGNGGLIELLFSDNVLTNDGTFTADLYVGEIRGTPEDFYVAIRPTPETRALLDPTGDANEDGYFELGRFVTGVVAGSADFISLIDIDRHFIEMGGHQLTFDAIQFRDDPSRGATTGATVGFDLESTGAISSLATGIVHQKGDTDEDGDVDLNDLNSVRNHFGMPIGTESPPGDSWPFDGSVDLDDVNNVRNNFGKRLSVNTVPELTSLALLVTGTVGLLLIRRCGAGS